jgi:hypothetical protein
MKKMALKDIERMDNCPCIHPLTEKLKKRVEELEKQMARISEKVNLKNNLKEWNISSLVSKIVLIYLKMELHILLN